MLMRRLTHLIFTHYLGGVVMTWLVLAALAVAARVVSELGYLGRGDYGFFQVLWYCWLILPTDLSSIALIGMIIGALFGVGRLVGSSELVAMQALGFDRWRIHYALWLSGLLVCAVNLANAEFLVESAEVNAHSYRQTQMQGAVVPATQRQQWLRVADDMVLLGPQIGPTEFGPTQIYQRAQGRLLRRISANKAYLLPDTQYWSLTQVEIVNADETLRKEFLPELLWPISVDRRLLSELDIPIAKMSLDTLHLRAELNSAMGRDAGPYLLQWWLRLVYPLAGLILLSALSGTFFVSIRDGGTSRRQFLACIGALVFFIAADVLVQGALALGLSVLTSAVLVPIFAGFLWLLSRIFWRVA